MLTACNSKTVDQEDTSANAMEASTVNNAEEKKHLSTDGNRRAWQRDNTHD